ncbi:MAG: Holliday junction branch migration protein RuvA [Flavobacterium sp. BFFFF2]|nr:MAG: Holliday junction branch migration protein RuvA [Flavobacterium sp. BFFFF2]
MIAHIQGKLIEKTPTEVVIDCMGVGYLIHISLHTYSQIPESENIKLYTQLIVREDAHTLYGFMNLSERELFRLLIGVSGIGANSARTILSSVEPALLQSALANGDSGTLQRIKGIGLKTAQRMVLELKDKVLKMPNFEGHFAPSYNIQREETLSALEVLGFVRKASEKMVDRILSEQPDATVEQIIKQALKNL